MTRFKFKVPVWVEVELEVEAASAYDAEAEALLAASRLEGRAFRVGTDGAQLRVRQAPHGPAQRVGGPEAAP